MAGGGCGRRSKRWTGRQCVFKLVSSAFYPGGSEDFKQKRDKNPSCIQEEELAKDMHDQRQGEQLRGYSANSGEIAMVTRTKILPVKQERTKLGAIQKENTIGFDERLNMVRTGRIKNESFP